MRFTRSLVQLTHKITAYFAMSSLKKEQTIKGLLQVLPFVHRIATLIHRTALLVSLISKLFELFCPHCRCAACFACRLESKHWVYLIIHRTAALVRYYVSDGMVYKGCELSSRKCEDNLNSRGAYIAISLIVSISGWGIQAG